MGTIITFNRCVLNYSFPGILIQYAAITQDIICHPATNSPAGLLRFELIDQNTFFVTRRIDALKGQNGDFAEMGSP
jgi:hypothetical protein